MNQTRRSKIRLRVFCIEDLKRIASVFHAQARLATKSGHSHSIEYTLHFADDTTFESDTPDLLDDEVIAIKRPVKVEFDFSNSKLGRRISFSVTHGDSEYGNEFWVRAREEAWLNDIFTRIRAFVDGAEHQSFWFVRHPWVLYNLLAIGIGSLGMFIIGAVVSVFDPSQLELSPSTREKLSGLRETVAESPVLFYLLGWLWRWVAGWFWGSIALANWLLSAWPNINLDFGANHLKAEKRRRRKIFLTTTLIVVPTVLTVIQDILTRSIK